MSGNNWSKVPTRDTDQTRIYVLNPAEIRHMQNAACQKKMVNGMANGIKRIYWGSDVY